MKPLFLSLIILFFAATGCRKEHPCMPNPNPGTQWKTLTSMFTARHHLGFVECNGLLYAIGGYNADGVNKVEAYDPATDTWETKAPMPTARGYLVVAAVSNKIYAIGGITGSDLNNITYTNVTEEYDPATNTWATKAPFPITAIPPNNVLGNQFIGGAAIDGKIYVAAGNSDGNVPTYIYDPATNTWSDDGKTNGKFNLEPYFATATSNDLYLTNSDNFLQFIPTDNEWRQLPPFTTTRREVCLASYDNKRIYSIGGYKVTYKDPNYKVLTLSDVEVYNISNSAWTKGSPLNVRRHSAAALTYEGNLYVVGGADKQSNFTDVPLASLEVLSLQ